MLLTLVDENCFNWKSVYAFYIYKVPEVAEINKLKT